MIPLYRPYMPELPALNSILYSGQLASGEYTKEFELGLRKYIGLKRLLVTSAYNTAILVAITTCEFKAGDEVIASPMACLASIQPYAAAGLKIVWADVDPRRGTLDPDSVKKVITPHTRGIIHNHFCGYPGYIDEINEIGKRNEVTVIDDGIECFGSIYKGKQIGNCGTDVTVFSFNPVRVLTTVDGGAVIFEDEEKYRKAILVRDCGIDRKSFRNELGEISPQCDITLRGHSATMSNVNAYIGVQQLPTVEERLQKQADNAKKWSEIIRAGERYSVLECPDCKPNYWVYGLLAPDKLECIKYFRKMGFYASGVHINNNIYSVFGKQDTLPGVQEFYDSFVAIPCGWWIKDDDWDKEWEE